jgi:hypothetical protein
MGEQQEETEGEQDTKITAINHEQIVNLTDQFMHLILQDIDENYQVINYQSKNELLMCLRKLQQERPQNHIEIFS